MYDPLERLHTFSWNSPSHPAKTHFPNLLGINNSHMRVACSESWGGGKYVTALNWLAHNLTSADYSVVPITSNVKQYAKVQGKIALGLELKCLIASLMYTEPHMSCSFHPIFLSGYLLWKSSLSSVFLYKTASLLISCFSTIRFIGLYVLNKNQLL